MPSRRPGKIFVLALVPPPQQSMLRTPARQVAVSIQPGKSTTRYNREWIVGQTKTDGTVVRGRIGFRGAEGHAEVWDEAALDFRDVAVPAGLTTPFAIDLLRLRLAVQTRGSTIKLTGLIGAFEALLSEPDQRWRINSPERLMSYADWRNTVDKVTSVRFKVRKPNPHYQGTPDIEALIEQAEAQVATLELSNENGIDTDAPFIAQSQSHVERGYGEAVYRGVRSDVSDGGESIYNTALGAEEIAREADVSEDGEVSQESLSAALSQDSDTEDTGVNGR